MPIPFTLVHSDESLKIILNSPRSSRRYPTDVFFSHYFTTSVETFTKQIAHATTA